MADKSKQQARELQRKTGMSHQAARNALASPRINQLHSFRWEQDPGLKFSARCPDCSRWICCTDHLVEGKCFCGAAFRIAFDIKPNWDMPQGILCMDCGAPFRMTQPHERMNPWRPVNRHQTWCRGCANNADKVELLRGMFRQTRSSQDRILQRYEQHEDPSIKLLLLRAREEQEECDRLLERSLLMIKEHDNAPADPEFEAASRKFVGTVDELEERDTALFEARMASMKSAAEKGDFRLKEIRRQN